MSAARAALATEVVFAWTTKSAIAALTFASGVRTAFGVGGQLSQLLVLAGQDLDDLVGVAECGVGSVDHRVQVRAARRQARSRAR